MALSLTPLPGVNDFSCPLTSLPNPSVGLIVSTCEIILNLSIPHVHLPGQSHRHHHLLSPGQPFESPNGPPGFHSCLPTSAATIIIASSNKRSFENMSNHAILLFRKLMLRIKSGLLTLANKILWCLPPVDSLTSHLLCVSPCSSYASAC